MDALCVGMSRGSSRKGGAEGSWFPTIRNGALKSHQALALMQWTDVTTFQHNPLWFYRKCWKTSFLRNLKKWDLTTAELQPPVFIRHYFRCMYLANYFKDFTVHLSLFCTPQTEAGCSLQFMTERETKAWEQLWFAGPVIGWLWEHDTVVHTVIVDSHTSLPSFSSSSSLFSLWKSSQAAAVVGKQPACCHNSYT